MTVIKRSCAPKIAQRDVCMNVRAKIAQHFNLSASDEKIAQKIAQRIAIDVKTSPK